MWIRWIRIRIRIRIRNTAIQLCTAKKGPVRIQYKCLVPICVFPEMKLLFTKQNYKVLSLSSFTHISARYLYISWTWSAYSAAGKYVD
jgi:hypothetical protein